MSPQLLGIIVGGLLPALFYGLAGVLAKSSADAGMPVGGHLIFIGMAVSATGIAFSVALPGAIPSSLAAVAPSVLQGIFWAAGTGCVVLGLLKYQAPLAKLAPLYNMNSLVTAGIALILFAEWRQVNSVQLLLGTGLIILGSLLVSGA